MNAPKLYFEKLAAAYVRGRLASADAAADDLFTRPLEELTDADFATLIARGLAAGLRLHRFKRTMELVRVRRVLGALHGLNPSSLLDIGSGRGAFLWPLLDAFPSLPVTSIDALHHRVSDIEAVRAGGVSNLRAVEMNAAAMTFDDGAFDVVTLLEVLEHIPDAAAVAREVIRTARRFAVVTVPSHEDDNPDHVHLFDRTRLTALFLNAGAKRVTCEYVLNHLIAVVRVGG
jgi:2-polyprenyl-3-methyl-5-hydroxy-6-metoxy-1,4-benzoquinol methylase